MPYEKKRIDTIQTLINAVRLDDSPTSYNSDAINTEDFTDFLLFLNIDSTLAPTDVVFIVQFSDDGGTTWYDYQNDFWGDLRYEDVATAAGIKECLHGKVGGRKMRLRAVATGTDATNYFDITAKIELFR